MPRLVLILAFALCAFPAAAGPTRDLVASLVVERCMPAALTGRLDGSALSDVGHLVTAEEKTGLGMEPEAMGWLFQTDDDKVLIEVGANCRVITDHTGDNSYLTALEAKLTEKFGAFQMVRDTVHPTSPALRVRAYAIDVPLNPATGVNLIALAVTYSPDGALEKMFYVGVLTATRPATPGR